MKTNKILLSSVSAALVVALSGCGGDSSKSTNVTVNTSTSSPANAANQSNAATAVVNAKTSEANKPAPAAAANNSAAYTPEKNSAERTAIFDALRVPVAKKLKQDVQFVADKLKVQGDWAFIAGKARNAQGGEPNWKITKYQEDIDNGAFDDNLFALLKKSGDKWSVVTYAIGCTDVCYLGWDKEFKAPKAIFE